MASAVDICNIALSHVGAKANIASISPPDGSAEAGYCARFYPLARQMALTAGNWQFATKRVVLALATANPSPVWAYAYTKPSDCIKPIKVFAAGATDESRDGALFEMEDSLILTNEPEAVLKFTHDVVDTTKYTPEFVSSLSYMLASYLAGLIIKGNEGIKASQGLRQMAVSEGRLGAASDANKSYTTDANVVSTISGSRT